MTRRVLVPALMSVAAATFALASPATAFAADAATHLKAWDPDKDGTLDLPEVKKVAEAKFDHLEKDKDGTLDPKEVRQLKLTKADFGKADPDKDGTLDKAEFLAIVEARFKTADVDGDGTLEVKELKTKAGKALLALIQ